MKKFILSSSALGAFMTSGVVASSIIAPQPAIAAVLPHARGEALRAHIPAAPLADADIVDAAGDAAKIAFRAAGGDRAVKAHRIRDFAALDAAGVGALDAANIALYNEVMPEFNRQLRIAEADADLVVAQAAGQALEAAVPPYAFNNMGGDAVRADASKRTKVALRAAGVSRTLKAGKIRDMVALDNAAVGALDAADIALYNEVMPEFNRQVQYVRGEALRAHIPAAPLADADIVDAAGDAAKIAFRAAGGDRAVKAHRIRDFAALDAAGVGALDAANIALYNEVMPEFNRQLRIAEADADLVVAQAAGQALEAAVPPYAFNNMGGDAVRADASKRTKVALRAAGVSRTLKAGKIRDMVALDNAAVGALDAADIALYNEVMPEFNRQVQYVRGEALRAHIPAAPLADADIVDAAGDAAKIAFRAAGGDRAVKAHRIRDFAALDAAGVGALDAANIALYNEVMPEFNRQLRIAEADADLVVAQAAGQALEAAVPSYAFNNMGGDAVRADASKRTKVALRAAGVSRTLKAGKIRDMVALDNAAVGALDAADIALYNEVMPEFNRQVQYVRGEALRAHIPAAPLADADIVDAAGDAAKIAFRAAGGDRAVKAHRIRDFAALDAAGVGALDAANIALYNEVMPEFNRQLRIAEADADLVVAQAAGQALEAAVPPYAFNNMGGDAVRADASKRTKVALRAAGVSRTLKAGKIRDMVALDNAAVGALDAADIALYNEVMPEFNRQVQYVRGEALRAHIPAAPLADADIVDAAGDAAKIAFRAAGGDRAVKAHRIRDFAALDAAGVGALDAANIALYNEVMPEFNRQLRIAEADADLVVAQAAGQALEAAVPPYAFNNMGGDAVRADASKRTKVALRAAGVSRTLKAGKIRDMVALDNAAVGALDAADIALYNEVMPEFNRQVQYVRGEALRAHIPAAPLADADIVDAAGDAAKIAFRAAGGDRAVKAHRIRDFAALDAAGVGALDAANIALYNEVMPEFNRQLRIAEATHAAIPHAGAGARATPAAPRTEERRTAIDEATVASTQVATEIVGNPEIRKELVSAGALSEREANLLNMTSAERAAELGRLSQEEARAVKAKFDRVIAAIPEAKKEVVRTEVRNKAWDEVGVAKEAIANATPAQHVQFLSALEKAPTMQDEILAITLSVKSDPTKVENIEKAAHDLKKIIKSASIEKLVAAASDDATVSSASKTTQSLLHSAAIATKYSTKEAREAAITKTVAQATQHETVSGHVSAAVSNVISRIDSVGFASTPLADSGLGASAGEEGSNITQGRTWISGVFGASKQDKDKGKAGYKGGLYGGTLGTDIELNDSVILGGAYSHVLSDFKYKDSRAGDKTNVRSHVFSIYAQASLNENLIWHNIVSLSKSNVRNKNLRHGATASSKLKSTGVNFETNLGYRITQDNVSFVPNVGLRYGHFKDGGFKESGAGVHNIEGSSSTNKVLTGILGAKVMWHTQVDDMSVIPHLQASVEHDFSSKNGKVNAKFTWMDNYFASKAETGNKAPKTAYNVGTGITFRKDNIELGVDYNLHLMKKYQAHQGSVKLKVAF